MKKILIFLLMLLNCNFVSANMIIPKSIAEQIEIYGYSPSEQGFFNAAKNGNVQVLGLFAEANAYINMKDDTGKTPVYYAAAAGQEKAVKFLLLCGADINVRDENLKSPLMAAIEAKSFETVFLLINVNASVKVSDENGYTPLHYAVLNNQKEIVQTITSKFCDTEATDNEGNTPLFYSLGNKEIMNILLRSGADINGINSEGKTVLHQAVIKNDYDSVKFLIENGANVNIKDQNDNTPIFYAVKNSDIYTYLIESGAKI
ncbi:ankyrin repeat domain-containing protein [bacterium]|nr:ankyrin repeat domain-containing protein [bacterium]